MFDGVAGVEPQYETYGPGGKYHTRVLLVNKARPDGADSGACSVIKDRLGVNAVPLSAVGGRQFLGWST